MISQRANPPGSVRNSAAACGARPHVRLQGYRPDPIAGTRYLELDLSR
jgi:hypothetical protein